LENNLYTLITGASSGIGDELAKVFAEKQHNLILTARRTERLESIKKEILSQHKNIDIHVFSLDLAEIKAAEILFRKIQDSNLEIDILVNNAGFGDFALFENTDTEKLQKMIQLNMLSLTTLCKLFLPQMIARKDGKILNVASTGAFQPLPYMAVYAATKAYVQSFSEAIAEELRVHNIYVCSLCPGPTSSGFGEAAGVTDNSAVFNKTKIAQSKDVARFAYKKLMKGKRTAIHGFKNKVQVFLNRLFPRILIVKTAKYIMTKIK
jgi:uncharacterized protein